MNDLLEGLRQSLSDPVTRHAMLIHLPIAVAGLAIPFVAALPFIASRAAIAYRAILASIVFLTAVVAWQAGEAGEAAEPIVEARLRTDDARRILHDHEERGEKVAPLMAATAAMVAFTLIPRRGVRLAAGLAATAASLSTAMVVVIVAHDGGRLVHWFDSGPGTHAGITSGSDPD